jgi:hypothetical protein
MKSRVHRSLRSRGPSWFDWAMSTLSFAIVSWFVVVQ